MSRSGYSEDCDNVQLWQGAVTSALRGKRGQAFLHEMLAALDALPVKRLIPEALVDGEQVCAIGSVGRLRGIDMRGLNPKNHEQLSKVFNIAPCMVQEIEFQNDDDFGYSTGNETPEQRFERVRKWVVDEIEQARARIGSKR